MTTAQIWAVALHDLGMTQEEYYVSYRKSLSLEWLPTTPFDFLALARNMKSSEYPDMRQAYLEAAEQKYLHCVAYETAKRVGFHQIKTQSETVTWKTWQEIYPQVCGEHKNGANFTLPESQQVTYERTVADSQVADNALAQMFALVGKKAVA